MSVMLSRSDRRNVMCGYSLTIRGLTDEDIRIHHLNPQNKTQCVAVEPADLGPCLGAVVNIATGQVTFSDIDGNGTPLTDADNVMFGKAVQFILTSMFEHLRPSQNKDDAD